MFKAIVQPNGHKLLSILLQSNYVFKTIVQPNGHNLLSNVLQTNYVFKAIVQPNGHSSVKLKGLVNGAYQWQAI